MEPTSSNSLLYALRPMEEHANLGEPSVKKQKFSANQEDE